MNPSRWMDKIATQSRSLFYNDWPHCVNIFPIMWSNNRIDMCISIQPQIRVIFPKVKCLRLENVFVSLFYLSQSFLKYMVFYWNMYNIIYETSRQSRFDARYWMLGAGALGRPRGMVPGGKREEGSGWGTRVYLWWILVDIWQNQYNILKLKNKIKNKSTADSK